MRSSHNVLVILAVSALPSATPVSAQEHRHPEGDAHGEVHFPITCAAGVQAVFDRAVALLHSYGYEEARGAFLDVAEQDATCGLAWWGVAMSYYHATWPQPMPDLAAGQAAARKAVELGARSAREQAYLRAIEALYGPPAGTEHRSRALAYSRAMEQLQAEFPDDVESSIFYALSLLGAAAPADTTYAYQKRAAEILNRLAPEHPRHPGIVHYTIHSLDYPRLAELALPAARIYAAVAPDVPHALHMPSHIFTRVGQWEESIASNLETARVAREQILRNHAGATAFEDLHARDYLVYAYLQLAQDEQAAGVVESIRDVTRFDQPNLIAAHALVALPARYALETRDWAMAASLEPPAVDLPWQAYPYVLGITRFANAIGAVHTGDLEGARSALAEIERLHDAIAADPPSGPYDWAGWLNAMRLAAASWLKRAEGDDEGALLSLTQAAELEETVGKHAVTPGPPLPAREQLADLLLALGRPAEALAAYEAVLADSPGRLNSLAGAARAAELAADEVSAHTYYRRVAAVCAPPACDRAIARVAQAFLSRR